MTQIWQARDYRSGDEKLIDALQGAINFLEGGLDGTIGAGTAAGIVILTILIGVVGMITLIVVAISLRSLLIHSLRSVGLFHPAHYRFVKFPWRMFAPKLLEIEEWFAKRAMSKEESEKWSGPFRTLSTMFRPGHFYLGRATLFDFGWFTPIGKPLSSHAMLIADSGYGKTTSLISMLSLHKGSAFVIDPKGQLATACFRRCAQGGLGIVGKGGRSYTLDPTGRVDGIDSSRWNPFDHLREIEDRFGEDMVIEVAVSMSEALVLDDSQTQPVFSNASRQFIAALILHVYSTEDPENRTPSRLYELLTNGVRDEMSTGSDARLTPTERLIMLMDKNRDFPVISSWITVVRDALKRGNEGSFLSSAVIQCKWMGMPRIAAVAETGGQSDFSLFDLRDDLVTVFVVASVSDIREKFTGWFRLLTVMLMQTYEQEIADSKWTKTLCIIDELPSLGEVDAFATSFPVMRDYGLLVVGITQDLSLLSDTYPNRWATMLSSADARIFLGTDDPDTLEYIANKLGKKTQDDGRDRFLAPASALARFMKPGRDNAIVFTSGERAMRLKSPMHFKELPVYLYDRDPTKPETAARSIGRRLSRFFVKGPAPEEPRTFGRVQRAGSTSLSLASATGVTAIARLTDGRIVTAERNGEEARLAVYGAESHDLLHTIPLHEGDAPPNAIAAIPDSTHVWVDTRDAVVCVDVMSGREVNDPISLAIDEPSWFYRVITRPILSRIPLIGAFFDDDDRRMHTVSHLAVRSNGTEVLSLIGATDRHYSRVQVWPNHMRAYPYHDVRPGNRDEVCYGAAAVVMSDGSLITGNEDGEIGVWDHEFVSPTICSIAVPDEYDKGSARNPAAWIDSIAVDEASSTLAVGTYSGTVHLLNMKSGTLLCPPLWPDFFHPPSERIRLPEGKTHASPVSALTFVDGGKKLLAVYYKGYTALWDLKSGNQPTMHTVHRGERKWLPKSLFELKPGVYLATQGHGRIEPSPAVLDLNPAGGQTSSGATSSL